MSLFEGLGLYSQGFSALCIVLVTLAVNGCDVCEFKEVSELKSRGLTSVPKFRT